MTALKRWKVAVVLEGETDRHASWYPSESEAWESGERLARSTVVTFVEVADTQTGEWWVLKEHGLTRPVAARP